MESFTPLLTTQDWNEEWIKLQQLRRCADDAAYWDKRSATFTTKDIPNPYVERFLELADIKTGETVFDMGCGTGALSIPLGKAGHTVIAADFSRGMLSRLQQELNNNGITTVATKMMSWNDDWKLHGITPNMVDVCLASRSVATLNLKEALLRLSDVARRRVCITLSTGSSPRIDNNILSEIGLEYIVSNDHVYAFNILINEGLKPELSYIESIRKNTFNSPEEAHEFFAQMIDIAGANRLSDADRSNALKRLDKWLKDNLIQNECAGHPDKKGISEKRLCLRNPQTITWAFISWNK